MDLSLLSECLITKLADAAATGTSDVNGTALDMSGFEGVVFMVNLATANAGNFLKAQEGDTSSPTADLAGTKVVGDNGNDMLVLEIQKPQKRYIRPVLVRGGATSVSGEIIAIQYGQRKSPKQNDVLNAQNAVSVVSPVAGTP